MFITKRFLVRTLQLSMISAVVLVGWVAAQERVSGKPKASKYQGVLGPNSKKYKNEDGKTLLWADGEGPDSPDAEWYDFTDSVIPVAELQFGIGKDRIRAIDDPLFVEPDDPRLMKVSQSVYRRKNQPKTNDEIKVIGFVEGGLARAYPVSLLDHHELVNDSFAGKPVTVGW